MYKKISLLSLLLIGFFSFQASAQYCFPTYSVACTSNDYINNVSTTGGISNISNLNSGCNGASPSNYTYNSGMVVSQVQGFTFNFSVQAGPSWGQGFRIWIDWNQDLDFADPGEDVYVSPISALTPFTGTITVPINATPGTTRMRVLCRYATVPGPTDYCSTTMTFGEVEDYDVQVISATPCTGTPTAGTPIPPITMCSGQQTVVSTVGMTLAGSMTYQWQSSTNLGATWNNVAGFAPSYQTLFLTQTTWYRLIVNCTPSGMSDTSAPVIVNVSAPAYATLPYTQDFENWVSYCGNMDVPNDYHWSSSPLIGNDAWRRDDQGNTANWTNGTFGLYSPTFTTGAHSARYHSYSGSSTGDMDLYLDCSAPGNKTLSFDYINNNSSSGTDFLEILFSPNGGAIFLPLATYNSSPNWSTNFLTINSTSANTIIRFRANGGSNFGQASDIGLDNIQVLAPCNGAVVAGTIDSVLACPNQNFTLSVSGATNAGGLNFEWQSAPAPGGPWTTLGNSPGPSYVTSIPTATYFRTIISCLAASPPTFDTTPVRLIDMNSFYFCYCQSQSIISNRENIGNVTLIDNSSNILLNNGVGTPQNNNPASINLYTNFTALTPTTMYRDSTYNGFVTGINFDAFMSNTYVGVYIDYDRNGIFDPTSELAMSGGTTNTNPQLAGTFTVPSTAQFGTTGMRVVMQTFGSATTLNPCGTFNYGETEDYLVTLDPPPCLTPPNAGTTHVSDTITCPGYTVNLIDTTHDVIYGGLTFNWQVSTDGVNYFDVPGAVLDTMSYVVNVPTWFRFRTTCNGTSNGYSNVVKVNMAPVYACYGVSQSTGTNSDSSDVGAMILSTPTYLNLYSYITGGPHLNNPVAVKRYTNYASASPMILYTDSTYRISVYHIMKSITHADAKVTVFIDYNNNQIFDIPGERVFSGIADINNFYLDGEFITPANAAVNVPCGMRVVLNNDVGPNAASDTGLGLYTSGETEDFLVEFQNFSWPTAVEELSPIESVSLYPNPTSGQLYVGFNAPEKTDVNIQIVSVTGAILQTQQMNDVFGSQSVMLDMSAYSKGVYLVKFSTPNGNFSRRVTVE